MNLPRPPAVIIFDFDGVILDSASIKEQAYVTIYANENPEKIARMLSHSRLHGGVTRRVKLTHYERTLFGRTGSSRAVDRLAEKYSQLVLGAVLECSFIAGAEEFLRHALGKAEMHVVSGTPHGELCDIVEQRDLARFFQTVQGAPASKLEAFKKILAGAPHDPAAVLAIGDSMTEYLAANELGISFLGIVPDGAENPFPANVAIRPSLAALHELLGIG